MSAKQKLGIGVKKRLGVLWVLLNVSTEFHGDAKTICKVMDMIQGECPTAQKMWRGKFKILVDDEMVFEWNRGEEINLIVGHGQENTK